MIFYAIDPVKAVSDGGIIVVIGKSMPKELFKEYYVKIQEEPLGTGDAVKIAIKNIKTDILLVTTGDNPLLEKEDIESFVEFFNKTSADIAFISAEADNPQGLGRVVKENDEFVKIVEESDATEKKKLLKK